MQVPSPSADVYNLIYRKTSIDKFSIVASRSLRAFNVKNCKMPHGYCQLAACKNHGISIHFTYPWILPSLGSLASWLPASLPPCRPAAQKHCFPKGFSNKMERPFLPPFFRPSSLGPFLLWSLPPPSLPAPSRLFPPPSALQKWLREHTRWETLMAGFCP